MSAAIEWVEGLAFAVLKDHADARHPVDTIGVDEVSDDIHDGEAFAAFVVMRPRFGQAS